MQLDKPLCLAFVLLALAAGAQPTGGGTNVYPTTTNVPSIAKVRPVSLRECLQSALQRNLDIQIARRAPNIARYNLSASYGLEYDPVFSFGANRAFQDQPGMLDFDKENVHSPYSLNTTTIDGGLSGNLTPGLSYRIGTSSTDFSGTTTLLAPYSATPPYYVINGIPYGLADPAKIVGGMNPRPGQYYQALAGAHLKQSLLRDFWIDSGRMQIQVDKKNLKISEQYLLLQVMNTVLSVQTAYYDLIYANENLKVMKRSLDLALELLEGDRKRVATGTLPPLSEAMAESMVETARANVLAAEELLQLKANALRTLLTDDFANAPEEVFLPQDALVTVHEAPDRSTSYQKALQKRPEVVEARLVVERQGVMVRYAHNQTFPTVDVMGSLAGNGVDDNSRSTAMDNMFDGKLNWGVGVVLKFPLSNTEARNKYKASQEIREQALLNLKKTEQTVFVQLDDIIKTMEKVYKRVGATALARKYAQAALDAEKQKLAEGTSTSFLVSQYEDRLVAARTAEILAVVDYAKAIAQLAFNEGSTLENHQITVDFR
jgi:outer membrane protein TolC